MEKNKKILIGAGALVVLAVAGGFCLMHSGRYSHYQGMMGWDRFDKDEGREYKRTGNDTGDMMDGGMGGTHDQNGMMHGISERQFLDQMIPHHQEAIETAKFVAEKGENAEVKKLAQDIVTTQEKEVADMKSWYKAWYGVDYQSDGTYKNMMPSLTELSGNKLDRAFLEGMIEHHMGALMMGQTVVPNIQHKEIETLAKGIAEAQSSEIISMRILLKQI